jgi:hypothetical protein
MRHENGKRCRFIFSLQFLILALSDFFLRDRTKQAGRSEKKY